MWGDAFAFASSCISSSVDRGIVIDFRIKGWRGVKFSLIHYWDFTFNLQRKLFQYCNTMAPSPGNQENSLVSVDFPQLNPALDVHSTKLREKKESALWQGMLLRRKHKRNMLEHAIRRHYLIILQNIYYNKWTHFNVPSLVVDSRRSVYV